jgi:hypothetical protein
MAKAPRLVPIWAFSRRACPNPVTHCKPMAGANKLQAPAPDKKGGSTNGHVLYMSYYFDKSGNMESEQAILSFAALAQPAPRRTTHLRPPLRGPPTSGPTTPAPQGAQPRKNSADHARSTPRDN